MGLSKKVKQRLKTKYGAWALITGASSGIGKAIANDLADSGLNLILCARSADQLNQLRYELIEKYHNEIIILPMDLTEEGSIDSLLDSIRLLDVGLFVSAAGFGTSGNFQDTNLDQELNMLKLNGEVSFRLTHHFAQVFVAQKRGGIILFGSLVGFQGTPYAAHYAATKAYMQTLAEALAVELKPFGVDVLSAAPGPVNSGFADRANMQMGAALTPEGISGPILKALGRKGTVLPGFLTKFLVYSLRTLPRWGKVRVMKLVMGGMTAHKRGA